MREEGLASLTARALAETGSHAKGHFGQFMAELQAEVIVAAEMVVVGYIRKALERWETFRSVGVAYISSSPQKSALSIADEA